jgi:SAM-dependent methyltransferase
MNEPFIFDHPAQAEFMAARREFLGRFLPQWKQKLGLRTVLDVGCGVGYFAASLRDMGFDVTAVDAREANIAEARRRHPGIAFHVADVEDPQLTALGCFDVVLSFGLLYHLENPFRTMRILHALTGKLLLVESICLPQETPLLLLFDEPTGEDQSLHAVSCYPSEGALIKMAFRSGFPYVYRFNEWPQHDNFQRIIGLDRIRTMIAGTTCPLDSPLLDPAVEPMLAASDDLWATDPTGVTKLLRKLGRGLRHRKPKSGTPAQVPSGTRSTHGPANATSQASTHDSADASSRRPATAHEREPENRKETSGPAAE